MTHLRQTRGSNCGQTCVAMLTGNKIARVEVMIGRGGTWFSDLRDAMHRLGWDLGSFQRSRGEVPRRKSLVLVRIGKGSKRGHWVAVAHGGIVHDPSERRPMEPEAWLKKAERRGWRVTSFAQARRK